MSNNHMFKFNNTFYYKITFPSDDAYKSTILLKVKIYPHNQVVVFQTSQMPFSNFKDVGEDSQNGSHGYSRSSILSKKITS
jgi:hypothetical protein